MPLALPEEATRADVREISFSLGVPQEAVLVHDVTTVDIGARQSVTVDLDQKTRHILRQRGYASFATLRPVLAL